MEWSLWKKLIKYLKWAVLVICLLAVFVLEFTSRSLSDGLFSQNVAHYWDSEGRYVQLSAFLADEAHFAGDNDDFMHLRYELMKALDEASFQVEEGNKGLVALSFSGRLPVELASKKSSAKAMAYGVYGDFFTFHPMQLLSGAFFDNDSDVNRDGVVIDENTAWQLFGATHIEGQYINIGDRTFVVNGVLKADEGLFTDKVMDTNCNIYMSMEALKDVMGADNFSVNCIELIMPNPVKTFAMSNFDSILSSKMGLNIASYELVKNTGRFGMARRLELLKAYPFSTMNVKSVVYPYWENRARGYEQIVLMIFVFQVLLLVYPVVLFIIYFRKLFLWASEWYWTLKYNIKDWLEDKLHL